jgi:hypothetical protein
MEHSSNIFQESIACITDYHYKKVFDIFPASKRNSHPLFIIKNTGKNYAEDIIIKISGAAKIDGKIDFSDSNCIKEELVTILEAGKYIYVRKDEKYKSTIFNFREPFGVQINYKSKILGQGYVEEYEANIKCGILTFPLNKDSLAWSNIEHRTILENDLRSRNLWEKHNQTHLSGDYMRISENGIEKMYKYIQVPHNEVDVLEDKYYETEMDIATSKMINKYIFVQKRGCFIIRFDKISSKIFKI